MENKHVTWLVVFDSTICRIYDYCKNQLILIKEIQHPENKLRDIDITSDKPGRYQSGGYVHGTYSQESDPKEIKIENFSREISSILEHGRKTHAYEKLVLVASPHMNGLLLKHINKQLEDLIIHNIEKDLVHLTENNLLVYLNEVLENH
ncbi:TPA: host attachment protein [Legionella pneumophila subsp. pneumophila]|nr:host attachment protein [Legionella pneumophila subsp. pneumophila]